MWSTILNAPPPVQKEWLTSAYEMGSVVTGDSEEITILRFLACKALRAHCTVEDVLNEILMTHSVECILF